ncbi:MAG: hypothetical protein AB9836_12345 [Aminipila sp.]
MLEVVIKQVIESITKPIIGDKKVFPVMGTCKPPLVTYTITPVAGGTVKESQIEVKAIAGDIDKAIEIREAISSKLDMTADLPSIEEGNIVFRSGLAGGGMLFNDSIQTWELNSIFIITWRCKD